MGCSCAMNILGFGYDVSFMVSFYELIGFSYTFHEYFMGILSSTGADPESFRGRWLTGWLPIVNHTGVAG